MCRPASCCSPPCPGGRLGSSWPVGPGDSGTPGGASEEVDGLRGYGVAVGFLAAFSRFQLLLWNLHGWWSLPFRLFLSGLDGGATETEDGFEED